MKGWLFVFFSFFVDNCRVIVHLKSVNADRPSVGHQEVRNKHIVRMYDTRCGLLPSVGSSTSSSAE